MITLIVPGRDVAVVERARMEEKRQRIDLLQKYSEDTCSRVHVPGTVYSVQYTMYILWKYRLVYWDLTLPMFILQLHNIVNDTT